MRLKDVSFKSHFLTFLRVAILQTYYNGNTLIQQYSIQGKHITLSLQVSLILSINILFTTIYIPDLFRLIWINLVISENNEKMYFIIYFFLFRICQNHMSFEWFNLRIYVYLFLHSFHQFPSTFFFKFNIDFQNLIYSSSLNPWLINKSNYILK